MTYPEYLFETSRYYFNPHAIPLFLSIALITWLGCKVVANRRSQANLYFGSVCVSVVVWLFFTSLGYLVRDDPALATYWFQWDWVGVSYISVCVYAFAASFVGKKSSIPIKIGYALATFFSVLTLTINPFMRGVQKYSWGFFPLHDHRWSPFFFVFFFGYMIMAFAEFIISYRRTADPTKRNQIKYIFLAFVVAYLASIDFLPTYGVPIYPAGFVLISLFVAITAYAILRHRLMDITIAIKKTLLYSVISTSFAAVYAGVVTSLARLVEDQSVTAPLFAGGIVAWLSDPKFYSVGYALGFISVLTMAVFVAWAKPRLPEARLWSILSFLVSDWFLGRFMIIHSRSHAQAFLWQRVMYVGAIYLNVVYYHFVAAFVGERGKRITRFLLCIGYSVATILVLINCFSHLFVRTMENNLIFRYYEHVGPFYVVHFAIYLIYPGMGICRLIQERFRSTALRQNQIDYVIVASIIGFLCGDTTFPLIFGIRCPPFGAPFVPIYAFIIGYAIMAHRLMDITIIIRKSLLYSLISAVLAAVYVGTITVMAQVWGGRNGPASVFSSVLAAIFITLLFNPLRLRTQRWIDRYFPREHLDPELLKEAAGGFAHEMKRPLSKISVPAEMVLTDLEQIKRGEKSFDESLPALERRMRFIINQSIEAGYMIEAIRGLSMTPPAPLVPVDLRAIIEGAIAEEGEVLNKNAVNVHFEWPPTFPMVPGRERQLVIVFVNLIKNAVEAMSVMELDKPREIRIKATQNNSQVIVHVTDTGPGIRKEDVDRIFESHFTTKGLNGSGMGLSLSRQITEAHGGAIDVTSEPGCGSTFSVKLPVPK